MEISNRACSIFCFLGLLILPSLVSAQEGGSGATGPQKYTFIARGVFLDFALQKLVRKTDIDLIYDPRLMNNHVVYVAAKQKSPEDLLRLVLAKSGIDFIQLSSGTYVLVKDSRQQASKGTLIGKVIDKVTGEPLEGAHVMLADATTGTSTNGSGYFNITGLEAGQHEVLVSYVGYESVKDTVWVPENNSSNRNFLLETKPVWVEPIVVSDIHKRLPAADTFNEQLTDPSYPSLGTIDAVKSLNTIMGINFSLAMADYNIQGGNTGQNQLRLDNVPVYNPVSMGRLIGAFSPFALGNIHIYKAGYGTPIGSQLSGIINLTHDLVNKKKESLLLQANPLSINGRWDQQLQLTDGPSIHFMVAARQNIWQWYEKPGLADTFRKWDQIDPMLTNSVLDITETDMNYLQEDHKSDIRYSDLHFAAAIEHNSFHTTRVSAYRGKNFLETNLFSQNIVIGSDAPSYMSTIDRYDWTNLMGKVEHEWLITPRLEANFSSYITKHELNHQYAIGNDLNTNLRYSTRETVSEQLRKGAIQSMDTGDENGITESALNARFNYSLSKNYQIKTGLKATHLNYRFQLSDLYFNTARSKSTSFLLSSYLQNNIYFSHKTSISAGSRFTFIPSRDLVFAEPRISLHYDEPDTPIGYLSAKLSGGIYRQFINQFDVSNIGPSALVPSIRFWVPVDFSTDVPKAYHLATTLLWEPSANWDIKFESYYKWMPTTLSINYSELIDISAIGPQNLALQTQYITTSKQYAYGTGLSIERVLPNLRMHLKTDYQYSMAERRIPGRFDGNYEPVPLNQPHQLGFSAEWQATNRIMLMLQWQSIWGRSWGFRKAYYDYLSPYNHGVYNEYTFENPSEDRLSPFHQLDAGISYTQSLGATKLRLRMHAFNVLDHTNVINWWLVPTADDAGEVTYLLQKRTLPGFSPSFSIKFSF